MPNAGIHLECTSSFPQRSLTEEANWYAIHTRPRHEKWIAEQLEEKRVITFLPLLQQIHQWSDRRSKVTVPMFSCYAFVRIAQTAEERLKVLRIPRRTRLCREREARDTNPRSTDRESPDGGRQEGAMRRAPVH